MKFVREEEVPEHTKKSKPLKKDAPPPEDPLVTELRSLVATLKEPKQESAELLKVAAGIQSALIRLADAAHQKAYQFDVKTNKAGRIEKVIATRLT